MKLVVAVTGATGSIYAVNLLRALKDKNVEIHGVISSGAVKMLDDEMKLGKNDIMDLLSYYYDESDMAAQIASGSFQHDGMVVIPCSMKTLSGIANGYSSNLIIRSADVTMKEGRRLIIVPRETPLNAIHLENMLKLARMNVAILPPMPAFYNHPKTIDDIVNHTVSRIIDHLGIEHNLSERWEGH